MLLTNILFDRWIFPFILFPKQNLLFKDYLIKQSHEQNLITIVKVSTDIIVPIIIFGSIPLLDPETNREM